MRKLAKIRFLTLEGIEGSGKTTQLSNIIQWLEGRGLPAFATREPGGTELADRIRTLLVENHSEALEPAAELLLYNAARIQHLRERVHPALEDGKIVVCDRFTDATVAYQAYGRGLPLNTVEEINRLATGGLTPDLTFLFDLEPAHGIGRSIKRIQETGSPEDRFEQEDLSFHERVRSGYLEMAKREPDRIVVIDANRPAEEVFTSIKNILEERL